METNLESLRNRKDFIVYACADFADFVTDLWGYLGIILEIQSNHAKEKSQSLIVDPLHHCDQTGPLRERGGELFKAAAFRL